ncbi:hypothetical protein PHYSODRAFT_288649 [Phytophthora sojae]|uniref:RxLR effector protein n=2 Tax=Phytophthora sojae TaxID=67593 RepID=G5A6E8_PHYSP|nr:hypothetical protein PHYSODRAFT_288649 [Phytophthora sojae]AEK81055.1 Avh259 [Phytophthora sojae]AEK81056.1 Avh259 [Phytophthora sojae]AEK81057.1 Avh259 [Phytophthora sojae]EGZ08903.1 hypothetical protein PHYSODRAFT_288649 [Phytophthora sojae]|eukprot:XP_009535536.1 hypothetical protein PHYSODRAFT_288649 [Phytophthora sojae]
MRAAYLILLAAITFFASGSAADQTQLTTFTRGIDARPIGSTEVDSKRFLRRRKHSEDEAAEDEERAGSMDDVVAKLAGLVPTLSKVRKSTVAKGMAYLQQTRLSSHQREAIQAFLALDESGRQAVMKALAGKRL